MASRQKIDQAREAGMGTHQPDGRLTCPLTKKKFIAAWLEGYELAIKRAHL